MLIACTTAIIGSRFRKVGALLQNGITTNSIIKVVWMSVAASNIQKYLSLTVFLRLFSIECCVWFVCKDTILLRCSKKKPGAPSRRACGM